MTDVEYRTLEGTTDQDLHEAFLEAFSDYLVRMDLPLWRHQNMLARRGYDPHLSLGAFADDRLVGFVLNGVREWRGARTAYDTGTGIVPDWRRRGLTTDMFQRLLGMLSDQGVERYLLEVIKENAPAEDLYRKQGFRVVRGLACYIGETAQLPSHDAGGLEMLETDVRDLDWEDLEPFRDFDPSWQNSTASVLAVPDSFVAVAASEDGDVVGFGIVEPTTGDIPQLAVRRDARRRGVGGALFDHLLGLVGGERVAVINVDEGCEGANGFASAMGLDLYTSQYEMVLDIGNR